MSTASSPLRLTLQVETVRDGGPFPVIARFLNVSTGPVRMLNVFDPLPVFFTSRLERLEDGADVDITGAGKADFFEDQLQTIDVGAGRSFDVALDLRPWIRDSLRPGRHQLTLTYHNAYGDDCFSGPLTSAPAGLDVEAA